MTDLLTVVEGVREHADALRAARVTRIDIGADGTAMARGVGFALLLCEDGDEGAELLGAGGGQALPGSTPRLALPSAPAAPPVAPPAAPAAKAPRPTTPAARTDARAEEILEERREEGTATPAKRGGAQQLTAAKHTGRHKYRNGVCVTNSCGKSEPTEGALAAATPERPASSSTGPVAPRPSSPLGGSREDGAAPVRPLGVDPLCTVVGCRGTLRYSDDPTDIKRKCDECGASS